MVGWDGFNAEMCKRQTPFSMPNSKHSDAKYSSVSKGFHSKGRVQHLHRQSFFLPFLSLFLSLRSAELELQSLESLALAPLRHENLLEMRVPKHALNEMTRSSIADVISSKVVGLELRVDGEEIPQCCHYLRRIRELVVKYVDLSQLGPPTPMKNIDNPCSQIIPPQVQYLQRRFEVHENVCDVLSAVLRDAAVLQRKMSQRRIL